MPRNRGVQKELKRQGYYDQFSKEARARREQQYRERRLSSKAESGYSDIVPMLAENLAINRDRVELARLRRQMISEAKETVKLQVIQFPRQNKGGKSNGVVH